MPKIRRPLRAPGWLGSRAETAGTERGPWFGALPFACIAAMDLTLAGTASETAGTEWGPRPGTLPFACVAAMELTLAGTASETAGTEWGPRPGTFPFACVAAMELTLAGTASETAGTERGPWFGTLPFACVAAMELTLAGTASETAGAEWGPPVWPVFRPACLAPFRITLPGPASEPPRLEGAARAAWGRGLVLSRLAFVRAAGSVPPVPEGRPPGPVLSFSRRIGMRPELSPRRPVLPRPSLGGLPFWMGRPRRPLVPCGSLALLPRRLPGGEWARAVGTSGWSAWRSPWGL